MVVFPMVGLMSPSYDGCLSGRDGAMSRLRSLEDHVSRLQNELTATKNK